jgi:hypothetical protein
MLLSAEQGVIFMDLSKKKIGLSLLMLLLAVVVAYSAEAGETLSRAGGSSTERDISTVHPDIAPLRFLLLEDDLEDDLWELRIFATSVTGNGNLSSWPGSGGKTGLAAGDSICQSRADAAGLKGTFKAWLSNANDDAYCRVHNLTGKKSSNCGQASLPVSAGPWVRTDGFPFSETIDQMLNGKVYTPLRYDEYGNLLPEDPLPFLFTNTSSSGTVNSSHSESCDDWSSSNNVYVGLGGYEYTYNMWTSYYSAVCNNTGRLICIQTGKGKALPNFAVQGKKVFVTQPMGSGNLSSWPGSGGKTGLAAGDSICQSRADAAGLEGTFKAWLSSSTVNAKDRLISDGPWVRLDGVKIADSKADLTDGRLFSSINLMINGQYISNYAVRTGTNSDGTKAAATCEDWTSASATGKIGIAAHAGASWTDKGDSSCESTFSIYCFEDIELR